MSKSTNQHEISSSKPAESNISLAMSNGLRSLASGGREQFDHPTEPNGSRHAEQTRCDYTEHNEFGNTRHSGSRYVPTRFATTATTPETKQVAMQNNWRTASTRQEGQLFEKNDEANLKQLFSLKATLCKQYNAAFKKRRAIAACGCDDLIAEAGLAIEIFKVDIELQMASNGDLSDFYQGLIRIGPGRLYKTFNGAMSRLAGLQKMYDAEIRKSSNRELEKSKSEIEPYRGALSAKDEAFQELKGENKKSESTNCYIIDIREGNIKAHEEQLEKEREIHGQEPLAIVTVFQAPEVEDTEVINQFQAIHQQYDALRKLFLELLADKMESERALREEIALLKQNIHSPEASPEKLLIRDIRSDRDRVYVHDLLKDSAPDATSPRSESSTRSSVGFVSRPFTDHNMKHDE